MLRIRIVMAAAVAAIVGSALLTAQSATAQTSEQPGKPLALLAGLNPPHQKKTTDRANRTVVHAKTVRKTAAHQTAAHKTTTRITRIPAVKIAQALAAKEATDAPPSNALPENAWPSPEQPVPSEASAAAAPAPDTAAVADDPPLSEMVVNSQTEPIAAPDAVNDRAAGDRNAGASTAAPSDNASAQTAATPAFDASVHEDASPVGSPSWIAQVLALLGGAIAAGAAAWFLIGAGPQRTYG